MKIKEQPMRVSRKFGSEMREIQRQIELSNKEITENIIKNIKWIEIKADILSGKFNTRNTRKRRAKRI